MTVTEKSIYTIDLSKAERQTIEQFIAIFNDFYQYEALRELLTEKNGIDIDRLAFKLTAFCSLLGMQAGRIGDFYVEDIVQLGELSSLKKG